MIVAIMIYAAQLAEQFLVDANRCADALESLAEIEERRVQKERA